MNSKLFMSLCVASLLAPELMGQSSPPSFPIPVPSRRIPMRSAQTQTNAAAPGLPQRLRNFPRPTAPTAPLPAPPATIPIPGTPAMPAAAGSTNAGAEPADVSYNFPAIPLDQLLDIYADLVGRTLLRANSGPEAVPATTTITLKTQSPLTRSQAIEALETILGMNGITIVPIGDKFAKIVTENIAPQAGDIISTNTNNIPEAGKFITQIVQIKYADPKDLVEALKPFAKSPSSIIVIPSTQTVVLRDYSENVARMLEMIQKIDVLTPNSVKPEVIPIKYALASDIASALSALGASGGTSVGKSSTGASFKTPGISGNGFANGTTGGVGGMNSGGYPGQTTQSTTSGLSSAATSGRSSFQQNLQRIVGQAAQNGQFTLFGMTKIIADERTNSLLVFANDEDMKMIKLIISKLDVVLAQVLIDAIIMEINLQDTRNTGVSYGQQAGGPNEFSGAGGLNNLSSAASGFLTGGSSSTNGGTTTAAAPNSRPIYGTLANLPGGFSYFGKYGNDLQVVLEAVAGNSRINVLSRPRIQTSHAVEADLFIGNTVPYVTGTYNYGYGSGPSSQYTQLEVGISLQVTPLINPDGLVVMDIAADVEQLGPDVQITGVGGVPTTTKRQAGAKVAVRSGETIILGGFISDSRSKSISGIPGLMNIPGLGNLFRSTSIENLRTELVMLMRPTVLPTPEVAAIVATEERDKLSGVKEAEWEIRNEESARNRDIEHKLAAEKLHEEKRRAKEAAKHKPGQYDPSTNTIPIQSIPAIED